MTDNQMNTLLHRCYDALKADGQDVRLANAPAGKCSAPYVAIYEGGEEYAGKTTAYRHILADIVVPKDKPALLSCQMAAVRTAMMRAGLSLSYAGAATVLDDYDALSINADFRALCSR